MFAEQHDQIKYQIDTFIELEHKNERILTEIRHKINLNKSENEKSADLGQTIRKLYAKYRKNREIDIDGEPREPINRVRDTNPKR